jgi:hypothetical protein
MLLKTTTRAAILLAIISTLCASCKKFDEDPELIHLRTVRHRIEGLKVIESHTIGNTDVNAYWHERFGDFYLDFTLYDYNPHSGEGYKLMVFDKATNTKICDGIWSFRGSRAIVFYFDCLASDTSTSWPLRIHGAGGNILKLSNKDLWLHSEGIIPELVASPVVQEIKIVQYKK